ncbi:MAG: hypothetical protein MRK00_15905 [Nitrosomonas sp.]|nr:hypothetical protein [Nitrosomonas sp.]
MKDKRSAAGEKKRAKYSDQEVMDVLKRTMKMGAAVTVLVAALYTGAVFGHGAEELEDDSCMRRIGENMIHLSVYQPQVDEAGHYCTDIPATGNTVLVVDLVDPILREMPIGVKLVRGSREEDGEVLANIRASVYADGVINTHQVLEQGRHLLVITVDGVQPLKYLYHLRVEMVNYAEVFRASIGPVVGLVLLTLIGYKLFRSKRFKNWMATKKKSL